MPKLNDHGLGGGGKAIGVPVYPFETVEGYIASDNGTLQAIYGAEITTIPETSYSNAGCVIGDYIYLIGMNNDKTACYKYNVKSREWTKLTSSTDDGQKAWAVSHGTDIYYGCASSTTIYKYDTLKNTHSQWLGATGHVFDYSRATIDGDYIYIFGGNSSTTYRTYATRIDIINKTYTRLAAIPYATYNQAVISGGDGYIYIFGGQLNSTAAYKYSIADNTYIAITTSPMNCYGTMIGRKDNLIYLVNSAASLYTTAFYIYDILTDTYTSVGSTPNARQYGTLGIIDDVIYMVGAGNVNSGTATTGDSLKLIKGTSANLSIQRLPQGVKVHTDGDVISGTAKDFGGTLIFDKDTTLEKTNGTVTAPTDGEYALVGSNYATIGG
jgi:N-acetylneuraminic acid mutarotase